MVGRFKDIDVLLPKYRLSPFQYIFTYFISRHKVVLAVLRPVLTCERISKCRRAPFQDYLPPPPIPVCPTFPLPYNVPVILHSSRAFATTGTQ